MSAKLLIVDDEPTILLTFRAALETDGYQVQEASTADEALMAFKAEHYDLAILDLRIGADSGLHILEKMRLAGIRTPAMMLTAYGSIRDAVRAMKLGAIDFLEKPVEPKGLRKIVAEVLERHSAESAQPDPLTFESLLNAAKKAVNLQKFAEAESALAGALKLNDRSPDAHNLAGVLHEIHGDYDAAKRSYGQAIRLDRHYQPAQQNMRRIYELFHFGSSEEPILLETQP
jgi:DNA-binding response OmpR family regulator